MLTLKTYKSYLRLMPFGVFALKTFPNIREIRLPHYLSRGA